MGKKLLLNWSIRCTGTHGSYGTEYVGYELTPPPAHGITLIELTVRRPIEKDPYYRISKGTIVRGASQTKLQNNEKAQFGEEGVVGVVEDKKEEKVILQFLRWFEKKNLSPMSVLTQLLPNPLPTRVKPMKYVRTNIGATNPRKSSAHRFSGVLLAKKWEGEDPSGWWMSEKLDGIRAYWTGSKLMTRNGNEIHAPAWFTDSLPSIALDGELIVGRGKFNKTVSAVKKKTPNEAEWKTVLYRVFDAPSVPGPCEKRWTAMKAAVKGLKHVKAVEQVKCKGTADLKKYHAKITKLGGEGVMLREAGSAYEKKRSSTLLKVKSFDDAEAKIVGYTEGTGRHKGRLGAYEAVLVGSRKKFKIGTGISDSERDDPLPIGTIVTVKFQELTPDGVPRFPSLVGARDYEN